MAKKFRVSGEWLVMADTAAEAESIIENAVAKDTEADLEDCVAELEDEEVEEEE